MLQWGRTVARAALYSGIERCACSIWPVCGIIAHHEQDITPVTNTGRQVGEGGGR